MTFVSDKALNSRIVGLFKRGLALPYGKTLKNGTVVRCSSKDYEGICYLSERIDKDEDLTLHKIQDIVSKLPYDILMQARGMGSTIASIVQYMLVSNGFLGIPEYPEEEYEFNGIMLIEHNPEHKIHTIKFIGDDDKIAYILQIATWAGITVIDDY